MTIDETKLFLRQAIKIRHEIANQRERLAMLTSSIASPRTTVWSVLKSHTGRSADAVGDAVAKKIGLEVAIEQDIARLSAVVLAIEQAVEGLEDSAEREVLRLRYLNGLSWDRVAARMNYTFRQCTRLHKNAIEKMSHNVLL